ncbi:hypothetical protein BOTNAR_0370g00070 [Botryotinia narcissicola]|uniref:Uncharacterized protein n=1 Tax=Botryotinia narcissicola TaxID=278944 RepID=A0A4Z1HPN3_9HELO|nr:hypothetical protein BOTNAR_0370g00070 [Botryotinia narcissicola]
MHSLRSSQAEASNNQELMDYTPFGTFRTSLMYGWIAPSNLDEQVQILPGLEKDGTVFNFQPEIPWNHGQYSEQHASEQQGVADPSYWMQQLSSTGYGLSSRIGSIDQ